VNVMVPAVVPVENTMFGCALSVIAVAPRFTANEATRVGRGRRTEPRRRPPTVVTDGLKVRVMVPAAATVAGAESCRLSVCCSPLAIVVLSKLQTSEDSGGENPVPASV